MGTRVGPDEAYRFARGETVKASDGQSVRLGRPLDFLVVADHARRMAPITDNRKTPDEGLARRLTVNTTTSKISPMQCRWWRRKEPTVPRSGIPRRSDSWFGEGLLREH